MPNDNALTAFATSPVGRMLRRARLFDGRGKTHRYLQATLVEAHFAWMHQGSDPADEAGGVRRNFADLIREIEADTQAMQAVFA